MPDGIEMAYQDARYDRAAHDAVPERSQIGLLFNRTGNAFELLKLQWRRATGLPSVDRTMIAILWSQGPRSHTELASELGISKPAVTAVVDRLIKLGYVVSAPDPEDRRRRVVNMTTLFPQIIRPHAETWRSELLKIIDEATDEQWEFLVRFMDATHDASVACAGDIAARSLDELMEQANAQRRS